MRCGPWPGLVAALVLACADAGEVGPQAAATSAASVQPPAPGGDPLLARARASLRDGELRPDLRAKLLASDDPAHARARRVLSALFEADDGEGAREGEAGGDREAGAGGEAGPPPPAAPSPGEGSALRVAPVAGGAERGGAREAPGGGVGDGARTSRRERPAQARGGSRPTLRRMSLREVRAGRVVLTVGGSGGVAVGLVNMPESGLVRLVFQASGASPRVLGMRGRAGGVRVHSVRRVSESVFVTLALDPGWSVASMGRVASGARVVLQGP